MKPPQKPENEEQRLEDLRSLDILDTPAEERFDRLTRLAKRLFGVQIALVSLVDENRQWFKSKQGLDASETPRDISFCGHAILDEEPFIIKNAAEDERFSDNPLVTDNPNIRFYAGYPLQHTNNSNLGTFCIIDSNPRDMDEDDLNLLKDLAELAGRELMSMELATIDELTKISNRRGFLTLGQNCLEICNRKRLPATLIFFDLNKFKPINDTFGHAEGDRALVAFADLMKETFRDSDVFSRLGGDEFAVLLTDTTISIAKDIIARFRQSLEKYNKEAQRGYDIDFSEGMVSIDNEQDKSIEKLLIRADALMYEKKHDN